ncbi:MULTISPECIES: hypothetical protein [unclassified Vibrio]|uniref:hypothetical protein n=1 Tax=unclassified Vibrio TaxID=2614977 RepID=UPI000D382754|nr:hypothetical protein [Vibrio sp. ZF 223]PTQ04370.1 hypothetical protein CWO13_08865 [Vibrio sp. ZF 223]
MTLSINLSINVESSKDRWIEKDQVCIQYHDTWVTKTIPWTENNLKLVVSNDLMCGISSTGRKGKDAITETWCYYVDIDDPTRHGADLIDHVHRCFNRHGIAHAISTSVNNKREKKKPSGEILPACPRLKVLIPLAQPIPLATNVQKKIWEHNKVRCFAYIQKILGEDIPLDKSSHDANRYSYRANTNADNFEWRFADGKPLPLHKVLKAPCTFIQKLIDDGVAGIEAGDELYYEHCKVEVEKKRAAKLKDLELKGIDVKRQHQLVMTAAKFFFSQNRDRGDWVQVCQAFVNEHLGYLSDHTTLTRGELVSFTPSFSHDAVKAGTIVHLAKKYGWTKPSNKPNIEDIKVSKSMESALSFLNNKA